MPLCPVGLELCEQSGFLGEIYFLCRLQAASPAERMSLLLRGHRSLLQSAHGFYFIFEGGRTIKEIQTDTRRAQSTGSHACGHTCSPGREPRAPALLSHRTGSAQPTPQSPHPPVTRGWSRERDPTPAESAPAPGLGISQGSAAAGHRLGTRCPSPWAGRAQAVGTEGGRAQWETRSQPAPMGLKQNQLPPHPLALQQLSGHLALLWSLTHRQLPGRGWCG